MDLFNLTQEDLNQEKNRKGSSQRLINRKDRKLIVQFIKAVKTQKTGFVGKTVKKSAAKSTGYEMLQLWQGIPWRYADC